MPYRTAWVPPVVREKKPFPWYSVLRIIYVLLLIAGNALMFVGLWCLLPGPFFAVLMFTSFPVILAWIVLVIKKL